jgi:formiminotetrahydrofolate cyclodeaminase
VLALTLAMAAGVVQMAARASSGEWGEAAGAAAQSETFQRRAAGLADRDAKAFEHALAIIDAAEAIEPEERDWEIGRAYAEAAEPPLEIGELALEVARLAAETAAHGDQRLRPDAIVAATLAAAVAAGAADLVAANLTVTPTDERVTHARRLAEDAGRAARVAASN